MENNALRWLRRVERKGDLDWVSNCRRIEVEGEVCRGRGMNTWGGRIDQLIKENGLRLKMAVDRNSWRNGSAPGRPTRVGVQTRASSRN